MEWKERELGLVCKMRKDCLKKKKKGLERWIKRLRELVDLPKVLS